MKRLIISRRFIVCAALSLAVVVLMCIIVISREHALRDNGELYWRYILDGSARESLKRRGDVFIIRYGNRKWEYYRTSRSDIERKFTDGVREYVDFQFSDSEDASTLDLWDLREVQALLGRSFSETENETRDWWRENRSEFVADAANLKRFKTERRSQALRYEAWRNNYPNRWLFGFRSRILLENPRISRISFMSGPSVRSRKWNPYLEEKVHLGFESLFFTLFIFFMGFGIPSIYRRIHRWRLPLCCSLALVTIIAHTVFISPHLFGYQQGWLGSGLSSNTIIFGIVFFTVESPPALISSVDLYSGNVDSPVKSLRFLEKYFVPVLAPFSRPLGDWRLTEKDRIVYPTFIYGNLFYGGVALIAGIAAQSVLWIWLKVKKRRSARGGYKRVPKENDG